MSEEMKYDLIVIGGGPAGMMCAGRAAELGARVLLLEKNAGLGKKLALTGGGRCNLTNAISDPRELSARYGAGSKALIPAFARFGPEEAVIFFGERGLSTKTEAEGRVFPATDDARDVIRVLAEYLRRGGAEVRLNSDVTEVKSDADCAEVTANGQSWRARYLAIATGGTAYPETGSTGDGFAWLAAMGHRVAAPDASLVPVRLKDPRVERLSGLSFDDAKATLMGAKGKVLAKSGKLLFTHFGLSGPLILNMSKDVGEALGVGAAKLVIDFFPKKTPEALEAEWLEAFSENQNKKIKNVVAFLMPRKLGELAVEKSGIDPEKFVNAVSRDERRALLSCAKAWAWEVESLLGIENAIVSSGGIEPREVDFRTMRSKVNRNVYVLGDCLNFNRPSGGFSLQVCWTTGYLAGSDIGSAIDRPAAK